MVFKFIIVMIWKILNQNSMLNAILDTLEWFKASELLWQLEFNVNLYDKKMAFIKYVL